MKQSLNLSKDHISSIRQALKVKEMSVKSDSRIKKSLLHFSSSNDYEEARTEWGFTNHFYFEGDFDFSNTCELCHASNLKINFVVENVLNGNQLKVGSTCIQKFLLLSGTTTQHDSKLAFIGQVNDAILLPSLHIAYTAVKVKIPYKRDINNFIKVLQEIMIKKGYKYPGRQDKIDFIVEWLYGSEVTERNLEKLEIFRLRQLLHDPGSIGCKTEKPIKNKEYRPETWMKQRAAVTTTSSRSKIYNPDYKYRKK